MLVKGVPVRKVSNPSGDDIPGKLLLPMPQSLCHQVINNRCINCVELEQSKRLRSEIPPTAPWLPILVFTSDPKLKQDKVKVTNCKQLPKIQILKYCKKLYMQHTFWSCLIRCINMKPQLKAQQSGPGMQDGRTDGETERRSETNIPPTTSLCRR